MDWFGRFKDADSHTQVVVVIHGSSTPHAFTAREQCGWTLKTVVACVHVAGHCWDVADVCCMWNIC